MTGSYMDEGENQILYLNPRSWSVDLQNVLK